MRRANDFYPTPEWATRELLDIVPISGLVRECCAGDGQIVNPLRRAGLVVVTNDIDRQWPADHHFDAAQQWPHGIGLADWVITNPPFNRAAEIIPMAHNHSRIGMAMLLRLSFLEPVEDRGAWLNRNPPTTLVVLPRISFTGDGRTDSVTCAWMVWEKSIFAETRIIVAENPKFAPRPNGATQRRFGEQFGTGIMSTDIGPLP